jgi:hypothetical protein
VHGELADDGLARPSARRRARRAGLERLAGLLLEVVEGEADPHPSSVGRTVADHDGQQRTSEDIAVDVDHHRHCAQRRQLADDGQRIAGPPPADPQAVGAGVDLRIETRIGGRGVATRHPVRCRDGPDVDASGRSVGERGERLVGPGRRQAQEPCDIVAGAAGKDGEPSARAGDQLQGVVDGAIAADGDQQTIRPQSGLGGGRGGRGIGGIDDRGRRTALVQEGRRTRGQFGGPTPARCTIGPDDDRWTSGRPHHRVPARPAPAWCPTGSRCRRPDRRPTRRGRRGAFCGDR